MARILLIEDSPTDRAVFTQWLEKAGHEVLAADNAEDGLDLARRQAPALVLMDVVLPGMSGFQATRTLARDEGTRHIPVLIISTKGMDTDKAWGLRQGASDYIVKPPREQEFLERVQSLVGA
ncbi:response regulator [Xanthomonas massiliensis]|jgi:twitching motility two-component system response regulator PilH|uniref:response regulator n=1 Tax=Xanthomonas massiliensis TaxID=1720302 RepID=UPI000826A0F0|nr:response regulator [Xanthomonas massiliensis]